MSLSHSTDTNYVKFLETTKNKILSTRVRIAKAACQEQISLYWWIGKHIIDSQEKYGWGKSIVETLAKDLSKFFQGSTYGFSARNLWDMRRFYLEYKEFPDLRQLVADLPWGQNLVVLNKVKNIEARRYYLEAARQMGWTRDILTLQINSNAFERHALPKKLHNFEQALPKHLAEQADRSMKDIYMLDTLGLTRPMLEAEVEAGMVNKIKDILLELGYGFTFVGNQYRIVAPSKTESFIDLLFFNRHLRLLVAVEIKMGKFKPEYAGKMNYYLNLLDDLVKEEWENPSIGIILCTERNHIDVEYALRGIEKPVGVSEFRLTRTLPEELSGKLPDAALLETEILKGLGTPDDIDPDHS
ncbi:MAG: hypothetical protein B7Y25_08215 [Alphaproteobacteria bacterium 16-39-46]|nr:MAG: hypothetical protein B7Y25_08215 [Alphaproteobacteria bacterium 16-39-46]OZA41232.1 MAG: hypothetical protein B7X84_08345 [Alphaproteobacteria bacterium 17-39-52]